VIDQPNYWLVFPIHGHALNQAIFLAQDFPKVYFLHTVREFIQNMGSHIKHLAKNAAKILPYDSVYLMEATLRQIYLDDGVHMNQLGLHGIHPYVPDSPDGRLQSRAVRLEDMHKDSEATMRSVAGWLGIAWDPVLIKSTYDGKLWNNRKEAIDRSGLGNKTILQKHTEVFNRFDRWRLKQIGRPRFLFYQYAVEKDFAPYWQRRWLIPLLLWIPFKVEWKFPHSRRMRKLLGLPKMDNIIVHVMRWKIKAGDLKKSRLPLFSLVCVYLMIEGMIRTRKYLMEIWRESLIKAPPGFVPLLHYRQDGT
jgi:hypothetical protein